MRLDRLSMKAHMYAHTVISINWKRDFLKAWKDWEMGSHSINPQICNIREGWKRALSPDPGLFQEVRFNACKAP